ncbi:MAG TPA: hypothetical protein VJ787_03730 [Thermoleophilia bacterium]|nr:hypothetical protein [Thermoleophilia bacterium]
MPRSGTCLFPGCGRTDIKGRGYCGMHYHHLNRGQQLRARERRLPYSGEVCSFDGCDRLAKTHGLCAAHYGQELRGVDLAPLRYQVDYDNATCRVEGCNKRPAANGLCGYHYQIERRRWVDEMKIERGCADCGYRDHPATLDFHHTDASGKRAKVSRLAHGTFEEAMAEIDKCIVLCANCHKLRHLAERRNPP